MADKSTKSETKEAPTPFKCPNDNCTKFHKGEFGELVGGEFVVTTTTYRCVSCHWEYEFVDGNVVKA